MNCTIDHRGIVRSISDESVTVAIATESACGDCHAKNICGFMEVSEKLIAVPNNSFRDLQVGDTVSVSMDSSLGAKAVVLAYIVPLFLLMATLFCCLLIFNELISTILAIGFVALYYMVLYTNRNKLEKTFSFSIIP